MSYHVVGYKGSVGTTANTEINALTDGILYVQNNHAVLPKDMGLVAAFGCSTNMTNARITTPSLRQVGLHNIRPVNQSTAPLDNPKVQPLWNNPLKLRGLEEIKIDVNSAIASGTETAFVILLVEENRQQVPVGDVINVRATGTTTVTAGAWSTVALTFDDVLPVGTYQCVGAEFFGATCVAGRLIFDGSFFRPGAIGIPNIGYTEHIGFASRQLGVLGTFRSTSLPRCEYLCVSADTAQTVYLQIVKVGS